MPCTRRLCLGTIGFRSLPFVGRYSGEPTHSVSCWKRVKSRHLNELSYLTPVSRIVPEPCDAFYSSLSATVGGIHAADRAGK